MFHELARSTVYQGRQVGQILHPAELYCSDEVNRLPQFVITWTWSVQPVELESLNRTENRDVEIGGIRGG